ncbi:MAG: hypothetical protein IAE79_07720 [Anaerolinea sp.]|nr:hypothetical protein [Anaerolinea sp.]
MLPMITYDRSARVYQVVDQTTGEVETFPAKHKLEAEQYALAMVNPRLVRIVRDELLSRRPFLEARAWKAAAIVESGDVAPVIDGLYFAYVRGQGDIYAVSHDDDGLMACTCTDFTSFGAPVAASNGQRLCKHLLAWQLYQRLQKHRCYHCSKLVDGDVDICPLCGEDVTPF